MKNTIKEVIREMILKGDIKIEIDTRPDGLHLKTSYFSLSVEGDNQPIKHEKHIRYTQ